MSSIYSYTAGAISGSLPGAADWNEDVVAPAEEKLAELFGISVESIRGEAEKAENKDHSWSITETAKWLGAKVAQFAVKHPIVTAAGVVTLGTVIAAAAGSTTAAGVVTSVTGSVSSAASTVGSYVQGAVTGHVGSAGTWYSQAVQPVANFLAKATGLPLKTILNGVVPSGGAGKTYVGAKLALTKAAHAIMVMVKHPVMAAAGTSIAAGTAYALTPAKETIVEKEKIVEKETVVEKEVIVTEEVERRQERVDLSRQPKGRAFGSVN